MDESPWKPIKYEDTIRKAKMAVDDSGFRYQQHEKTSPSWPCKERRSVIKCPARMEVNNEHYRIHGLHNHSTEAYNVKKVVDNHINLLKWRENIREFWLWRKNRKFHYILGKNLHW